MGIRHALAVAGFAVRIGGLVLPALAQTLDDAKTVPDQSMAGGDQKSGDMRGGSVAGLIAVPGLRAAVSGLLSLLGLAVLAGSAHAAASDWASNAHGSARLISAVEATGSGTRLDVGLQLRLTPGWHTYWRTPGDAGVAPTIDWQGSENLAGATVAWPAPLHLPPAGGLETIGYENGVVLPISVTLERAGAPLRLHAEVDYASCKDVCIPYHASLDLALPTGLAVPGPEATLIAAARTRVPGDLAAARLSLRGAVVEPGKDGAVLALRLASSGAPLRSPDVFVEGIANGSPARPAVALTDAGDQATLRVPIRNLSAAALAGSALHLTVVDGARSGESDARPQLGVTARSVKNCTLSSAGYERSANIA